MASVFHHLLAALCFADLIFLFSLVIVSPVFISTLTIIPVDTDLQVALGVSGFPLWLYHLAECFCHLGLAASVFLTIAITIERYQVLSLLPIAYR